MDREQKNESVQEMPNLSLYDRQIERIRQKLTRAARTPGAEQVFGAGSHGYRVNEPMTLEELDTLQKKWGVLLPEAFAAFLTGIGNGGPGSYGGAGPYYGIYGTDSMEPDVERLAQASLFRMSPAAQDWQSQDTEEYAVDESLDDDAYNEAFADLLKGTLEIGTMGCDNEILLIVSGEHRGRVVYMNMEYQKPFFTHEKNFLDWYERWLDEIIAGFKIHWFGTTPGGSEQELVEQATASGSSENRAQALKALLRFPRLEEPAVRLAEKLLRDPADNVRYWALTLLAAHAPDLADPKLMAGLGSEQAEDRRTAAQLIHWYRKKNARNFAQEIQTLIPRETDEETFRFLGYIAEAAGIEPLPLLLTAFRNPDTEIRKSAIWQAGKSNRKADYVDEFIEVLLHDPEPNVVHTAIQSLGGVTDLRLLPAYEQLLAQHPADEHYIPGNIRHRLKEYGFRTQNHIDRRVPSELTRVRNMLRKLKEERR